MGEIPPRIKSVRVQKKNPAAPNMVGLEAEMEYEGDMHIELALGTGRSLINFGISELTLKGTMEILLGPSMPRMPFYAAQQVSFLNPPDMDYKLTGVASIADSDIFRRTFRSVTDKIFNEIFVLPARTCSPTFPDIDFLQCTQDHIGVLRVRLLSAHKFANTDKNILGIGAAPDVYVRLTHSGVSKDTRQYKNQRNPKFQDETMDFVISSISRNQLLDVKAYDWDLGTADDLLGYKKIGLLQLTEKDELKLPLTDKLHGTHPYVRLRAKQLPLSYDEDDILRTMSRFTQQKHFKKNCSPMILKVNIAECKNLPNVEAPYVKFKVGRKIAFETGSAAHGRLGDVTFDPTNPIYLMPFTAFIEEPITKTTLIEFTILDRSNMRKIGTVSAYLMDKTSTEFNIKDTGQKSILRASIRLAAIMDDERI